MLGKRVRPEETVSFCDFCKNEKVYLTKCKVCDREYCLVCGGIGINPFGIHICKECIHSKKVEAILQDSLEPYRREMKKVEQKLNELGFSETNGGE